MNWQNCFSAETIYRQRSSGGDRSHYQRDYDRLIFSSSFRRLQAKTQVFPLPGSTFVHNRLTHSLEVASVGRSLGASVGARLIAAEGFSDLNVKDFYKYELANVIAAGCLAHDVGNPAFGHSGEKAISNFFIQHEEELIGGQKLRQFYSLEEWNDLINFEGNANALRVLTQKFKGKNPEGLGLTISTLASILKYPCSSTEVDRSFKHRKKYGYFQSEKEIFDTLVDRLSFTQHPVSGYSRHPFVYLVEAADDICYSIIDMEDAHRLGILDFRSTSELLLQLIEELDREEDNIGRIKEVVSILTDENEAISFLRAKSINTLVMSCVDVFMEHRSSILAGTFNQTLIGVIEDQCPVLRKIEALSIKQIYNHHSVIEIEIAGYNVMSELLSLFLKSALSDQPSSFDQSILSLVPPQFSIDSENSAYLKTMNVLDHISAMTDTYATELYRKIKGIEISKHR